MAKYELTDEFILKWGIKLHRIRALKDFGDVKKGDLGGYVESESNLSHHGNCWAYDNARVYGNTKVYGDAQVYGRAEICGDAQVSDLGDYLVLKNNWSSGRYFTYTKSNKMWRAGCFYGTGEELIAKAYKDSKLSGDCYKEYVDFVKRLENLCDRN